MSNKEIVVNVRFSKDDVLVLDRMATETTRNRSSMVRHLVKLALRNNLVEQPVSKPAESVSRP